MSNIIGGGGGDSEWTVDGNGNLVPKDGEPVSIEALERVGGSVGTNRPLFTTSDTTVTVDAAGGADYTSIQSALNDMPIIQLHKHSIVVNDGDYTSEGALYVPPFLNTIIRQDSAQAQISPQIIGNTTTPSNVTTGPWTFDHGGKYGTTFAGFDIQSSISLGGNDIQLAFWGCGYALIQDLILSGTSSVGVLAFDSTVNIQDNITFSGTISDGFRTKHSGDIGTYSNTSIAGSVGRYLFNTAELGGPIRVRGDQNISATATTARYDAIGSYIQTPDRMILPDGVAPYLAAGSGMRLESGEFDVATTVAASSDGTWDTRQAETVSVSFSESFSATPTILTESVPIGGLQSGAAAKTASGFTGYVENFSTTASEPDPVGWVAIGPE